MPAQARNEPKSVGFDKLPKEIKALHNCAKAPNTVEMTSQRFGKSVMFVVSCPAPRGALTPLAVYLAKDARGAGAKRVKFEAPGPDGGAATLETLPSVVAAREAFTKPDDPVPNTHKKDEPWITGAWAPEDRPGVCAVSAIWRLQDDKGELWLWEEAKECPKDALPKYEAKADRKPPPLVEP
jgi:hypothetical protein